MKGKLAAIAMALWALLLLLVWTAPVHAQGRPPIHVQLVLDSSGSMLDNDPDRLSSLAGMIFADLAGPEDRVGLLSMRKDAFLEHELEPAKSGRRAIRTAVGKLSHHGPTYCARPLELAAEGLARSKRAEPAARQFVIFLSDGVCPDDGVQTPQMVDDAAHALKRGNVRVFSIGLFETLPETMSGDPLRDLKSMARITGGEYFRAEKASDLPRTFADILGRIVGSEAQDVELGPGKSADVTLDGYIYDASLIVTGNGKSVVVTRAVAADGKALKLPGRAGKASDGDGFFVSAFTNDKRAHYSVLRLDEPPAGRWTFEAVGPEDLDAILIQNYALDPILELADTKPAYQVGDTVELRTWLRGKSGKRIDDPRFLEKVSFTVYVTSPDGKENAVALTKGADGNFSTKLKLEQEGKYACRGRAKMKSGGLDKSTEDISFESIGLELRLAEGQKPFELGDVKAGTSTGPFEIDLSASKMTGTYDVTLAIPDAPGVDPEPSRTKVNAESPKLNVTFHVDPDHPGGEVDAALVVTSNGQTVKIPCRANILPLTFWEKFGSLVMTIGAGILLLALLLFIMMGITSPHSFNADARINWGETLDRLEKNELLIRDIPGTGRGFYKNAKLRIGGPNGVPSDGVHLATLEATGRSRITLKAEDGLEIHKVKRFDPSKTTKVDGEDCSVDLNDTYKLGKLYIRVR